jgi:hypothetical protein
MLKTVQQDFTIVIKPEALPKLGILDGPYELPQGEVIHTLNFLSRYIAFVR